MADSHVIPNFIRKRLTGEVSESGQKKFQFRWVGRKDLPKQDLPKPNLMCIECDSLLGSNIERHVPSLLMPSNVDEMSSWRTLPITPVEIHGVFETEFYLGRYDYDEPKSRVLEKFVISVAWRALHALKLDGEKYASEFLSSPHGSSINKQVCEHLFHGVDSDFVHTPFLYYWPPKSASLVSTKNDEMPFAWASLHDDGEFLGVAVIFAYWVVVWPLFDLESENYFSKIDLLNKTCFFDWVSEIMHLLSDS
ncbi:hypothetical protein [Pseudomonas japonica]|uniref:Uncharacterized protein n=1 Tax=Pseudomonas japonica TaxID=256466 RepID=A0A239I4U2_9PSED|nr:hypothetical protein [Pseudomonas japonica]SNS88511.1 hypothetical protein SAMN05444352_117116 [Pseudomonas japonica]